MDRDTGDRRDKRDTKDSRMKEAEQGEVDDRDMAGKNSRDVRAGVVVVGGRCSAAVEEEGWAVESFHLRRL